MRHHVIRYERALQEAERRATFTVLLHVAKYAR